MDHPPNRSVTVNLARAWWSWVPLPILAFFIAVFWSIGTQEPYEIAWLRFGLILVLETGTLLVVALVGARSFLRSGDLGTLFLGCGTLALSLFSGLSALSAFLGYLNAASALNSLGALFFGCCHLVGIVASRHSRSVESHRKRTLAMGYLGLLAAIFVLSGFGQLGRIPIFFVQGTGGTPIRQWVLGSTTAVIAMVTGLLWRFHQRNMPVFPYWYSVGLALLGLGLAGSLVQTTSGSLLSWCNRTAQFLGCVYMLTGIRAGSWRPTHWDLPLRDSAQPVQEADDLLTILAGSSLQQRILRFSLAILAAFFAYWVYQIATLWVGPGLPTYVIFYPCMLLVAMLAGPGPGIVMTALSALLAAYWMLPPAGLGITAPADRLGLVIFSSLGVFVSLFAEFYQRNRRKAAIYDQEASLRAMRKDKDFLAEVLQNASLPFASGYPDGRISIFNPAFAELIEYSTEELRSLQWTTGLTPAEWHSIEGKKLEELQRTGQPVRYEKEYLTKSGKRVPVELLVHLVRGADGQPDYYYSFVTDITARKQAEMVLQRYELLARHTRDILLFVESDSGRIVGANTAAESAYGYPREELLELNIADLRAPTTRDLIDDQMSQADTNGILFETTHRRRDGSTFPVEVNSIGSIIGGVRVLLSTIRDITKRRQWEVTLRESEATLRAILDATQESIWLFDKEGVILTANRTALQRVRRPASEVIGTHFATFMNPDVASVRNARLKEVMETGHVVKYEDERGGYTFDHTFYPVHDAEGRVQRVASFSRNITETRKAELELKRTNARIRLLSEISRTLLSSEEPWEVMETFCRKLMDFLGCQVFFNYITDESNHHFRLRLSAGIPSDEINQIEILPFDAANCDCDGKTCQPSAANTPCPLPSLMKRYSIQSFECHPLMVDGKVLGTLALGSRSHSNFTDEDRGLIQTIAGQISMALQRVESRLALQRLNAELADSNQLLEQHVLDRTRELNTRMHQLQALTLQLNRAEEEERRRIAQVIHDHLQQLLVAARLGVDTLTYRAKDEATLQKLKALNSILVDSIQVSRSLTAELYPSVLHLEGLSSALTWLANWYLENHNLDVQIVMDPGAEMSELDLRIMVFRTVRELLFNVVKHSGVSSAQVQLSRTDSGFVKVEVADEGVGFDALSLETSESSKAGFGLFTLRQRIELFGGSFEIQSAPGMGTHITVTVPIAARTLPVRESITSPSHTGTGAKRRSHGKHSAIRILLADDHPVVREGLAQMLKEEPDFEVVGQVSNGQDALAEARRLVPDVMVMDVAMPIMGGIEATRRILAEMPQIKILGLSMYDDESHAEVMREAGAVAFLDKGGPISILKSTIRQHAGV
jgi:PAS domain S-box-containing protein